MESSPHALIDRPLIYVAGAWAKRGWLARFLSCITFSDGDKCWEWKASTDRKGYGQFNIRDAITGKKNLKRAHRIAYELFVANPGEKFCCHRCDNPLCCNPSHIFLGTNLDNVRDMDRKGRRKVSVKIGEKHSNAILSNEAVREIKERLKSGKRGIGLELAAEYGVSPITISAIKVGRIRSKA